MLDALTGSPLALAVKRVAGEKAQQVDILFSDRNQPNRMQGKANRFVFI